MVWLSERLLMGFRQQVRWPTAHLDVMASSCESQRRGALADRVERVHRYAEPADVCQLSAMTTNASQSGVR